MHVARHQLYSGSIRVPRATTRTRAPRVKAPPESTTGSWAHRATRTPRYTRLRRRVRVRHHLQYQRADQTDQVLLLLRGHCNRRAVRREQGFLHRHPSSSHRRIAPSSVPSPRGPLRTCPALRPRRTASPRPLQDQRCCLPLSCGAHRRPDRQGFEVTHWRSRTRPGARAPSRPPVAGGFVTQRQGRASRRPTSEATRAALRCARPRPRRSTPRRGCHRARGSLPA